MKLNPIAVIIVICLFTNTNAQMFPTDSVALAEMKTSIHGRYVDWQWRVGMGKRSAESNIQDHHDRKTDQGSESGKVCIFIKL